MHGYIYFVAVHLFICPSCLSIFIYLFTYVIHLYLFFYPSIYPSIYMYAYVKSTELNECGVVDVFIRYDTV